MSGLGVAPPARYRQFSADPRFDANGTVQSLSR